MVWIVLLWLIDALIKSWDVCELIFDWVPIDTDTDTVKYCGTWMQAFINLRPYLATEHYQTNADDNFVREYSTGKR